ncbi:hypothetical protein [Blastococcus montanus]|uniref:hypothetical protein n=1 Tax=Blastococcus montanus TaxID=3144973 RepID=UPI00320A7FFC
MTGPPGPAAPRLTVRRGTAPPAPAAARRLSLAPAEWAVLTEGRLPGLPAAFAAAATVTGEQRDAALSSLTGRGILVAGGAGPPVPAVAAQLEVLRRPVLTVRLDVTGRGGARHGWFALGAGVVAGAVTLPGGSVELSLTPAAGLGHELARAVPEAAVLTASGAPVGGGAVPAGRLPLALLDTAVPQVAGPTAGERALADELLRRTAGSLACLVVGRAGDPVGAGQVSWLATDAGWVGLRPAGTARQAVDVLPVRPADLGTWVAPAVAALLEAADEQG